MHYYFYTTRMIIYIYNRLENIGKNGKKNFIIILLKSDAHTNTWKHLCYISISTLRSQIFCSKYYSFSVQRFIVIAIIISHKKLVSSSQFNLIFYSIIFYFQSRSKNNESISISVACKFPTIPIPNDIF